MRLRRLLLIFIALVFGGGVAHAQQTPISWYTRLTGNINFVATGATLRSQDNNGNACAVTGSSTAPLTGIPGGASVVAAYLYWGGSGSAIDSNVVLNGSGVIASRTFTATFNNGGTNFPYFGAFADVTSRVSGNGSFTFTGLTVNTGTPHCGSSAVAAGWSLVVIYGSPSERLPTSKSIWMSSGRRSSGTCRYCVRRLFSCSRGFPDDASGAVVEGADSLMPFALYQYLAEQSGKIRRSSWRQNPPALTRIAVAAETGTSRRQLSGSEGARRVIVQRNAAECSAEIQGECRGNWHAHQAAALSR